MPRTLFLFLALVMGALMLVVDQIRPPIPVDETRYLTVAWELWVRGEYILPTLNFEPYHHKPPMLFWLINIMWAIFGEAHLWAARLIPYFAALGALFMTYRLGRVLWPTTHEPAALATVMLAATPFFMIYSGLIMFDTLLTVAVLGSIYSLVRFYQTGKRRWVLTLGLTIGAGVLIKGPVAALHILPLIILFPVWQRPFALSYIRWGLGVGVAFVLATLLVLAWALPAARLGGPEYERMIFWGQSAGRMVQSFDHGHPWWFYVVFLPILLLPWPFIPALWGKWDPPAGLRHLVSCTWQSKLILAWVVPVFIAFSAISGKQVHYLIPLMPGLFLLIAHYVSSRDLCAKTSPLSLFIAACAPFACVLVAVTLFEYSIDVLGPQIVSDLSTQLAHDNEEILLAALMVACGLGFAIYRNSAYFTPARTLKMIVLAHTAGIAALHISVAPILGLYYDVTPLAERAKLEIAKGRDVAVANPWHGEMGYVTRQSKHYDELIAPEIQPWFDAHPNGIVLYRHPSDSTVILPSWRILATIPYRSPGKQYSILEMKK